MKIKQEFLSVPEVAQYFGVSTQCVRRWMDSGELRYIRVGNSGQPRVSRSHIGDFVKANEVQREQIEREMVTA